MKIYRLYENVHNDLVNALEDIIIKDNKKINNFEVEYDSMNGVFSWFDDDYIIYATPYWEGYKKLPINVTSDDGDEINYENFELPTLRDEDDIKDCLDFYYEHIDKVTKLLNKRTELNNKLEIIKKSIGNVFIKDFGYYINKIIVNQISDSDVIDLLKIINEEYSDVLVGHKYNL